MMQLFLVPNCPSVASSGAGKDACFLFFISAFILRGFEGAENPHFSFLQRDVLSPSIRAHWLIFWNMWILWFA